MKRLLLLVLLVSLVFSMAACQPAAPAPQPTQAAAEVAPPVQVAPSEANKPQPEVILATTTSTRDSGLLDVLLPLFEKQSGYQVKMVAVGTGEALKMGELGNADVLLVHAPKSEEEYMDKGFGKERMLVMHNDFILVGPRDDPAKIKETKKSADALKKIAEAKAVFVSRGDDSGTHKKELTLWEKAGVKPAEADTWYLQSGQGMGDTLKIASEKIGYTLTDRATYLSLKDNLKLDILLEGEPSLLNIYHVITVNPEKYPLINQEGGLAFAQFMVAPDTQKIIGEFGVEKFGQPLFFPDVDKKE